MLAHRIIPVLLTLNGNLVKGKRFDSSRVVGNVQQAAEIHQARGVDELIILDVGATHAGCGPDFEAMGKLTECCFMPVAVGGGVTKIEHVRELLANGADKVVIGTAAVRDPGFIGECAYRFGSQAIVVALDCVRQGRVQRLMVECGTVQTQFEVVKFAKHMEQLGVGELILTDISRDGTLSGYNLRLISAVAKAVDIPVIANGGAGSYSDMYFALKAGASAVAAGAAFQWLDLTPHNAAEYISQKGLEARL